MVDKKTTKKTTKKAAKKAETVIVKNVKVHAVNLVKDTNDKKNKAMQQCLKYISLDNARRLLPKKSKIYVSFELDKTCTSIANGIRRCLIDEIEIMSLDFNENTDLITNDRYILCDFVKKQICLLPIDQDIDYNNLLAKETITLSKENNTDQIIEVTSNDLHIGKKPVDIVGMNIVLFHLRPGKSVKINNIHVISGVAKDNAGKFSSIARTEYRIIDVEPKIKTDFGSTGNSSMNTTVSHFYIGYSTHRNINKPLGLMVKCCDT